MLDKGKKKFINNYFTQKTKQKQKGLKIWGYTWIPGFGTVLKNH